MEINIIEIFPNDETKLKEIEMAKSRWFVNIISKKYSKDILDKAFSHLEQEIKGSKADA